MFVTWDEKYWEFMPQLKPEGAPCGKTYDDAQRLTYCPHNPL